MSEFWNVMVPEISVSDFEKSLSFYTETLCFSIRNQRENPSFAQACQTLKMTRTNGRFVQEVCREMVCAGEITPSISFYHDPGTRAIAYESNGALFINTAKKSAGAGGPGNIAHEVTHTLDYTHFTN